jgi:hypothetical protein
MQSRPAASQRPGPRQNDEYCHYSDVGLVSISVYQLDAVCGKAPSPRITGSSVRRREGSVAPFRREAIMNYFWSFILVAAIFTVLVSSYSRRLDRKEAKRKGW